MEERRERRRCKRLELDVVLQLERLDEADITTVKYAHVEVHDLSKTGIGFRSKQELEIGSMYNTRLQIWTKETIEAIVKVVHREKKEDGVYQYGGQFVGMNDPDALKIEIYQMFNDN